MKKPITRFCLKRRCEPIFIYRYYRIKIWQIRVSTLITQWQIDSQKLDKSNIELNRSSLNFEIEKAFLACRCKYSKMLFSAKRTLEDNDSPRWYSDNKIFNDGSLDVLTREQREIRIGHSFGIRQYAGLYSALYICARTCQPWVGILSKYIRGYFHSTSSRFVGCQQWIGGQCTGDHSPRSYLRPRNCYNKRTVLMDARKRASLTVHPPIWFLNVEILSVYKQHGRYNFSLEVVLANRFNVEDN